MVRPGALVICVATLVSFVSSAFLPEEYFPNIKSRDEELPLETREKCPGKKNRRLPTTMTVDISLIDPSYLDRLVKMDHIHTRSLSPWDYSLNKDPNRFPSVIAKANCLTYFCVDSDGNQSPHLISSPIQQEMMVLRWEQKGCSFSYRLETEVVTLGCTCIRPIVTYY
ncbi:interleukin-17A-like [Rhinoderma darwinii]|uniref:interleukin-17A-like n=1 Tax=Rhinoderma darwinii TaxID=43563 RepID=UPI003F666907